MLQFIFMLLGQFAFGLNNSDPNLVTGEVDAFDSDTEAEMFEIDFDKEIAKQNKIFEEIVALLKPAFTKKDLTD